MMERRRTERFQAFTTAAVQGASGRGLECAVRNLSGGGACLVFVQKQTELPGVFSLNIESGSMPRACRLVWQSSYRVGVQFVTGC
jgi:hypothetical protein